MNNDARNDAQIPAQDDPLYPRGWKNNDAAHHLFTSENQSGENNYYRRALAAMSDEERAAHYAAAHQKKRQTTALRKGVQQLWLDGIQQRADEWQRMLERAAESVLIKAIERGDAQAFNAISDRILGKVAQTMRVEVDKNDTQQDILERIQALALDGAGNIIEADNGKTDQTDGGQHGGQHGDTTISGNNNP